MEYLNDLKELLTDILADIDDDTRYDDVADQLEQVVDLVDLIEMADYEIILTPSLERIMDEAYDCKGAMIDVTDTIRAMLREVNEIIIQ